MIHGGHNNKRNSEVANKPINVYSCGTQQEKLRIILCEGMGPDVAFNPNEPKGGF